jgi:hypothetical protein
MRIATTFLSFKIRTGLDGQADKRGSKIRKVDQVFEAYEARFTAADVPARIALTSALFSACKDWLQAKEGRSIYKTQFLKPTSASRTACCAGSITTAVTTTPRRSRCSRR